MSAAAMLRALRFAAGSVFVAFGAGKFVNHASELASFKSYGLPAPELFVPVIGVIELVGGMLLIVGIVTRPAALVLAGDMIGAIVVSGSPSASS
jgi:putative oxidoreductase